MNVKYSKKPLGLIASMFLAILFTFSSNAVFAKSYEVAYLSASSANTWLGASVKAMEAVAGNNDINITEFDAQFDPAKQTSQLQDAIASGKYQGIVVCAIYGVGLIPDIEAAIAAGIEIVVLNQVVGPDLTTSDPQVDGIAASVLASPYRSGTRHGELTVRACEGDSNCEVVFIYGIKGIPLDDAIRQGFDDVISQHSSIKVVAEGEGKYLGPDGGIAATQDILSMNSSFDVMVGADQSMQGAAIVLADEGMTGQVKLIGLGGSAPAMEGIADGSWFAGVLGAPATEGRYAMEAMVDALKNGVHQGGIDPLATAPDGGLITSENVSKFTAEWDGQLNNFTALIVHKMNSEGFVFYLKNKFGWKPSRQWSTQAPPESDIKRYNLFDEEYQFGNPITV